MDSNRAHTPTPAAFRRAIKPMASRYFITAIEQEQFLADYDRMIAQVEAAAEQRWAIKALREAADDLFYDGDTDRPLPGYDDLYNRADQMEGDDERR